MLQMASVPTAEPGGLRGREREVGALQGLLRSVADGTSGTLILTGAPGIGKTALLRHAFDAADRDVRVERIAAAESEMELSYAGLHLLCGRVAEDMDRLHPPQQEALEAAFGLRPVEAPSPFLVGLAVLSLLAAAASERPLICIVDDAHRLDDASARAIGFAARRLGAERVALVLAMRDVPLAFEGLPRLDVAGLDDAAAQALFDRIVPGPIDAQVRDHLLAEARGNPSALRKLAHGVSPEQIAGGFALVGSARPADRMERSVLAQIGPLPEPARLLLLLAAAEPTGDAGLLRRASDPLSLGQDAFDAAVASGELSIGARVEFRNPLARAAVYRSASQEDRRRVHAALAQVTSADRDADRSAWHHSLATIEFDAGIADALERSAVQARKRGGVAATAAFLERAAALTREPDHRVRRLLGAAHAKFEAGASKAALLLLDSPEMQRLTPPDQARATRLRARARYGLHRERDAVTHLISAARDLTLLDVCLARETYLEALGVALDMGHADDRSTIGKAMLDALAGGDAESTDALLMRGVALLATREREAAIPVLRRALGLLIEQPMLPLLGIAGRAAEDLWDADTCRALSDRHVELARADGALACLPAALTHAVSVRILDGRLEAAEALADEADVVIESTGNVQPRLGRLQVAAWRGDEQEVRRQAGELRREAETRGEGSALDAVAHAEAVLNNGLGRYADVVAAGHHARAPRMLPEIVEAAARTGDTELAEEALQELTLATRSFDSHWARGTLAAATAQLDESEATEALYREAIACFKRGRMALLEGRAHLCFGEWLRRHDRRIDARGEFHEAETLLSTGGAAAFAERARRELAAAGETVCRRTLGAPEPLTAQERNIARMACEGLTNREIGARLFISARTVEYHMRKVFLKLAISSRRQLAIAMRGSH